MDATTIKATHKSSVTAILGSDTRPVHSHGTAFFNKDRWTGRALLIAICNDIAANPGGKLTVNRVANWVSEANAAYVWNPSITIADTPNQLNDRIVGALVGGAYHEAFHTKYSCRRDLTVDEIMAIMKPRWAKMSNWANAAKLLLDWSNIVEDIRIERLGCKAFPGVHTKMCDLQDFILDLEAKGNAEARSHGVKTDGALSVIGKTFRDLGLGYDTNAQRAALASYQQDNPQAYQFTTTGAVAKSLNEAINLSATDDLGCLRIAFDVLIAIADASKAQPQPQQGQQGQQQQKGQKGQKGDQQGQKADQQKGDKGDKQDGDKSDESQKGDQSDKGDKGDKGDQSDASQAGDESNEGDDQQADGNDGEADGQGDEEGEGEGKGEGNSDDGDAKDSDSESSESSNSAGGHDNGEGKSLAEALKDALENGDSMGMKDNNQALSEAFQQIEQQQTDREGGVEQGEAVYRPANKTLDRVVPVAKSRSEAKRAEADKVLASVKDEVAYLRARLRNVFRAAEMTATIHGTRTGRTLSDRMLVDSRVALLGGNMPNRAYMQRDEQQDMSLACSIVIDQSGSMSDKLAEATQAMLAIAEPMDAIGAKVQAVGFRDGQSFNGDSYGPEFRDSGCHQFDGVDIDVFKDYGERFASVKSRFACTRAVGGTPMANGIQFALNGLNNRKEGHRVLFVITDGEPNWGHAPVIKRQIRIAKEAGIHVIGVGIGYGAQYVTKLFPDHVFSPDMKGLPQQLVAKVNGIIDRAARKRGQRMAG